MIILTSKRPLVSVCGTRVPAKAFDMLRNAQQPESEAGDIPVIYRKRPHYDLLVAQAVNQP